MNLSKVQDFFEATKDRIHIIGCGSVGSTIAENLVRCGVTNITLYDFDYVEPKNIANQMFRECDIGQRKVDALKDILCNINPDCCDTVKIEPDGWKGKILNGFVFLCPDNIEVRKDFVKKHINSTVVKAVFDVRTLLESAQHFAADWSDKRQKEDLLNTMQFTHEEAKEEVPMSACGVTLGVAPTVRLICSYAVCNYINFVNGRGIKKIVIADAFGMTTDAF